VALLAFESGNSIRRFDFALVGVLYDGSRCDGSGMLYRVVRFEMELDLSLL
jgi:hypothetical protein